MRKKPYSQWIVLISLIFASFLFTELEVRGNEEGGGDIIFSGTKSLAPVLFSHQKHKDAGNRCNDCHPAIFKKEKGSTDAGNALTMKALKKGQYCGTCHDGSKAFSVNKTCTKCHVKG